MKVASLEAILRALNNAGVRYLVVGGVAVNGYGYGRTTFDLDLVVELTPESIDRAFRALASIDYRPVVPITASMFGDTKERERAVQEKQIWRI